jgi:hypothetical protein
MPGTVYSQRKRDLFSSHFLRLKVMMPASAQLVRVPRQIRDRNNKSTYQAKQSLLKPGSGERRSQLASFITTLS